MHIYTYTEVISTLESSFNTALSFTLQDHLSHLRKDLPLLPVKKKTTTKNQFWSGPRCISHILHSVLLQDSSVERSTYKYSFGLKMHFTIYCKTQKRPQSFRLFFMMTSVTASKTNCTFLVSVAHVKWVYISFVSFLLLRSSNWHWIYAAASSYVFEPDMGKGKKHKAKLKWVYH